MKLSQKQKRLLALALVLIAFTVLALLNTVDFSKTPEITTNAPYAPDTLPPDSFYPTSDGDLSKETEYLTKDLTPSYTTRNGLTEDLATAADYPYTDFFKAYFAALQNGDSEALNNLHSEVYFRNHTPYTAFSKQYLYDVTISYFDQATIEKADSAEDQIYIGRQLTYFEVTYRIYKNDGSFRRDIVDDMAITQIFTLLLEKDGSNPKLNSISYWNTNTTPAEPITLLPLILPLIWLGITVISLTVLLILKKRIWLTVPLAAFSAFLVSISQTLVWQTVTFIAVFLLAFSLVLFLKKKKEKKTSDIN